MTWDANQKHLYIICIKIFACVNIPRVTLIVYSNTHIFISNNTSLTLHRNTIVLYVCVYIWQYKNNIGIRVLYFYKIFCPVLISKIKTYHIINRNRINFSKHFNPIMPKGGGLYVKKKFTVSIVQCSHNRNWIITMSFWYSTRLIVVFERSYCLFYELPKHSHNAKKYQGGIWGWRMRGNQQLRHCGKQ